TRSRMPHRWRCKEGASRHAASPESLHYFAKYPCRLKEVSQYDPDGEEDAELEMKLGCHHIHHRQMSALILERILDDPVHFQCCGDGDDCQQCPHRHLLEYDQHGKDGIGAEQH